MSTQHTRTETPMTQDSLTLREILSQPRCWSECLEALQRPGQFDHLRGRANPASEWLFVGCGTSYYLAQSAAASFTALTRIPARAAPASEIMLFPEIAAPRSRELVPVLISRSGRTSEVLQARRYLEEERGIRTLAITCDGNELGQLASWTLCLPVEEQSTVMTSSFTSMLMALQYLAAVLAGNQEFTAAVERLPASLEKLLERYMTSLKSFLCDASFDDFVFLGQGPFYGIASEGALKVTESSCSYSQVFHTLEFRHGPKSIVSAQTLLTFMISERGYQAEVGVLEEMKQLGGSTLAITNQADERLRNSADFVIELDLPGPGLSRLCAYVVWAQLIGVYNAGHKGLDPDQPRHLSRVVVLDS